MGNFIALLFQPEIFWRLSCTDIKESRGFFLVERSLLSNALPNRALSIPEFKCYILQCRRAGGWNKVSLSSTNDLLRNGGIGKPKVREAAIESLKEKHFIEELPRKNNVRRFKVKGVPLYDWEKGEYIPSPYARNIKDMKVQNNGYIQVPSSLVDDGIIRHLSGREIKVLIKLYQYNRYDVYGGIDPNIISLIECGKAPDLEELITEDLAKGETYIVADRGLYEDLYLDKNEFLTTLRLLARKGLVKVQKRSCSVDANGRIVILQGEDAHNGDTIFMLQPKYQISHHVKTWRENNEGRQSG